MSGYTIDKSRYDQTTGKTGVKVYAKFEDSGQVIQVDVADLDQRSIEIYLAWPKNAIQLVMYMLEYTDKYDGYDGKNVRL